MDAKPTLTSRSQRARGPNVFRVIPTSEPLLFLESGEYLTLHSVNEDLRPRWLYPVGWGALVQVMLHTQQSLSVLKPLAPVLGLSTTGLCRVSVPVDASFALGQEILRDSEGLCRTGILGGRFMQGKRIPPSLGNEQDGPQRSHAPTICRWTTERAGILDSLYIPSRYLCEASLSSSSYSKPGGISHLRITQVSVVSWQEGLGATLRGPQQGGRDRIVRTSL